MPKFTDMTNGLPVFINLDHVVYAEPGGNDTYTNIYLGTHGMKKVKESFAEVAASLEPPVLELAAIEAADVSKAADEFYEAAVKYMGEKEEPTRDTGDPQQRETPAGSKNKNKDKQPDAAPPTTPPEKKAE